VIEYLHGDATRPATPGPKLIVHVCNDGGAWGAGFVLAVSKRWPQPKSRYREWHGRGDGSFKLGEVQPVKVEQDTWVVNMIGQVRYSDDGGPPIRYGALRSCLREVARLAMKLGASVHMPRIGCGLAGGSWDMVGPIVEQELHDLQVLVYDLDTVGYDSGDNLGKMG
jgi:O-acetyl-ADP-ribose deacetylase (regulator of RNase III)